MKFFWWNRHFNSYCFTFYRYAVKLGSKNEQHWFRRTLIWSKWKVMLRRVSRKSTFYSCRGYAVISVILRRLCSIILWSRHWSVSEGGPFFWLPREECGPHGPHCCCSVVTSCPNLCNPMDSSTPGFPVLHYLPELAQSHARCISDSIQSPHLLLSSSPSAFNLFQHHGER